MNLTLREKLYNFDKLTWKQALSIFPTVKKIVKACIDKPDTADEILISMCQDQGLFLIANLATFQGKALNETEYTELMTALEEDLTFEQGYDIFQNFFTTNSGLLQKIMQLISLTGTKQK